MFEERAYFCVWIKHVSWVVRALGGAKDAACMF